MDTHVKVLGVLHIAFSALSLLAALFIMLVLGGAAGIVGASGDPDARAAVPILGMIATVLPMFLIVMSLPGVLVGIGLLKLRPWARIGGIVLSVLDLFWIPLGTIVGIYGLWVLFSKDTERLFTPSTLPQAAPQ